MSAGAAPGLYLHVPFCRAACPYCDFAIATGGARARGRYVDHLLLEIERSPGRLCGEPFDTIYLGGGTPSALERPALARILERLRGRLPIADTARVLLEANPEDVTREALAEWRGLGVGTLSLGVQSLDDSSLRFLGRRHTAVQARRAVERALEAGLATVSMDLIYGLPGQTGAAWRRELEAALRLAPNHFSCYQLTVHEKTAFGVWRRRGRLRPLGEDAEADLFRVTHELLGEHGWCGYEVSSFAAGEQHRSPHNLKYWSHAPYLGLGPSAHSFDGRERWWNVRALRHWEQRLGRGEPPVAGRERLGPRELALEALMLGLRTTAGVDLRRLRDELGFDVVAANRAGIGRLQQNGLVALHGERLVPTLAGLAVADALAAELELGDRAARPQPPGPGRESGREVRPGSSTSDQATGRAASRSS